MAEITPQLETPRGFRWKTPILLAALALFGFYASTHMVAAGDTWVALACGRHFAHHGVDTVEPFSFNSHPAGPSDEQLARFPEWTHGMIRFWHPTGWINQNWLTHLTFYKLITWFGRDGAYHYETLVYWKYALFGTTIAVVFALGKILGAGDFAATLAACCAMVVGRSFYDIRPACYSNLLVPLFILLLALSTYKHYKYIWLMVPLIVLWANLHGGYIYAYMMLAPFLAVHLLLNLPRRWTIAVGLSGLWMALYLLYYKYHGHMYYLDTMRIVQPGYEKMGFFNGVLLTGVLLAGGSILLASRRRVPDGLFIVYHLIASLLYPLILLVDQRLDVPAHLNASFLRVLNHFRVSSLLGFLLLLIAGLAVIVLLAVRKERFVRINGKTLMHIAAAAGVSFAAMIVFNPFRLTNLTHTFEISISEHAASWRAVNEWRPAFNWMDPTTDRPNPVGDETGFAVMCLAALLILPVWAGLHLLKPHQRPVRKGPRQAAVEHEAAPLAPGWPNIDIAMMLVGALTMYMAFQSRRFIALAGPSASPVLAAMVFQIGLMFTAGRNWKKNQRLEPTPPPLAWQKYAWLSAAFCLLGFGGYVIAQYHRIYVAPWPVDEIRDSVFMRMTASHQKPFEVCRFINDNKLTGRIFNYWTEGGSLAFGQTPDPETGKTPLQHFMDGRAQAAFDHDTFKLWQYIYSGGPLALQVARENRSPSADETRRIGQWLDEEMKARQVWIVLMPKTQADSPFMRSLMTTPNWKTAYLDEMQHLLVDAESPPGRQLIADIFEDRAVFPDDFSRRMTRVRLIIEMRDSQGASRLFEDADAAYRQQPCPSAMIALIHVSRIDLFKKQANLAIRGHLDAFIAERENLPRQGGSLKRIASAMIAARHLAAVEPDQQEQWRSLADALEQDYRDINQRSIW